MKIRRFVAPDMRQAIRMVREEQGPDAVILSNRRLAEGVEIVAATDYDERLLQQFGHQRQTPSADSSSADAQASAEPAEAAPLEGRSAADEASPAAPRPEQGAASFLQEPQEQAIQASETDLVATIHQATTEAGYPPAGTSGRTADASPGETDPALAEMRQELKVLRDLVERRLSGLAWGDLARRSPRLADLVQELIRLGLRPALAQEIAEPTAWSQDFDDSWQQALQGLAHRLPIVEDDILSQGGVVALVGPTGVGKTTTIAKLAARYALRYGTRHVALVTTDSYRIAAHEQLRVYGQLLEIPVRVVSSAEDLEATLQDLADKDLVLVDTAGMSQRDVRLSEQFAVLRGSGMPVRSYLVLATTTHSAGLDEAVRAFSGAALTGCILTKLDETTCLGGVLDVAVRHQLAVAYVSDGQRVPEDIHMARGDDLVARAAAIAEQAPDGDEALWLPASFGRTVANA